jgi:exonuclease III
MNIWRSITPVLKTLTSVVGDLSTDKISSKISKFIKGTDMFIQSRHCKVTYSSHQLKQIRANNSQHVVNKILPFDAITTIRQLRLNRRKRGRRGGQNKFRSVNPSNLTIVDCINMPEDRKCINMSTINCRSIKSKAELVHSLIDEKGLDTTVMTETWLTKADDLWSTLCDLNNNGLTMIRANRTRRKGGGIALVSRNHTFRDVKMVKSGESRSFEHSHFKLLVSNNSSLNLLAVYRPPYSTKSPYSVPMFVDDLTKFLMDFLTEHSNVVIMGDFNVHVNNLEDPDVILFCDTMSALGLEQHVSESTHDKGNTLDLVFTEAMGSNKVKNCCTVCMCLITRQS